MKSKIYFFSMTIFRKNAALYWPIWMVYLIGLLLMPVRLWIDLAEDARGAYESSNSLLSSANISREYSYLYDVFELEVYTAFAFVMAILTATALFSFLYSSKACQMIHAFPVTRRELYITNIISGFCFMLIPEILTFIFSVIVCLSYGVTCVQYIGIWLLFMMGISIIAYAMAVFCCMLTGQIFAGAAYFVILNFICPAVQYLFSLAALSAGSGIGIYMNQYEYNKWLCPFSCLIDEVGFHEERYTNGILSSGIEAYGGSVIAWYLIPAVLFYVLAYVIYRHRQLEDAGNLVTVPFLKPVFRWGSGFMFGYAASLMLTPILAWVIPNYFALLLMLLVGVGCVCFFLAQMLLKKSFKVFNLHSFAECMVFVLFLLASFGIMRGSVWLAAKQVPDCSDVERVCVVRSYPIWYSGSDIQHVIGWHEQIVERLEEIEKISRQNDFNDYENIEMIYQMKDGTVISRQYLLPYDREPFSSINLELYSRESDAEVFLNNYLNEYMYVYGNRGCDVYCTDYTYQELYAVEGSLYFYKQNNGDWVDFKETEAEALYEASVLDVKAGKLQKYNIINPAGARDMAESDFDGVELQLVLGSMPEISSLNSGDLMNTYITVYLQFGSDCTNILQALLDNGIIASEEELYLEEEED